jgi:hypothetical protein
MQDKRKIECSYDCGCWFDYDSSEEVTQSCIYHQKKILTRSDVRKDFGKDKGSYDKFPKK